MGIRSRILLFCLTLPAFSQQSASPPDRRVTLDVNVTDKSGKPVSGLQQSDFTLIDNKQPQNILSFQVMDSKSDGLPVEVFLLVDRVNSTVQNSADVRQQVGKYLNQNGGQLRLPTSFIFFSDSGTSIQKAPTRDGHALLTDLDQSESGLRTVNRSQGVYGAIERFQMSLHALDSIASMEETNPARKLLIWLSPGWPLLSGPGIQLTPKNQQELFNTIVATSTALTKARITLYSIDTLGVADAGSVNINYYREFLKGVSAPKQVEAGDLALQVIATQSGGRALNSSNDIGRQIENSMSDTTGWYVLTFDSPRADGPNEYHKLDLKVGKPGLTARTRTGYYAQP
jgi:VWFA-related protein